MASADDAERQVDLGATALAAEQEKRLVRTLTRLDTIFLIIAAVVALDVVAQVASYGGETFTWALVIAVFFLVPMALIFAETGAAFTQEGGPYQWVKYAFGRGWSAVSTVMYWITNPIWLGGSLAFVGYEAWNAYVFDISSSFAHYLFLLIFIWFAIFLAIISLKTGKHFITAAAIAKIVVALSLVVTALIYAIQNGAAGLDTTSFSPTLAGFLGVVPLLLFAYVGFEAPNAAAEEMENPGRDVPRAIGVGATVTALTYLLPIFAILAVIPADQVSGIGGFLDAVAVVYSVWGGAAEVLLVVTAILFVYALANQGSSWMIVTDRMQAMAAADGSFFGGFFGEFSERLHTPVRMNILSGVVSTVFMIAAMQLTEGDAAAIFVTVLIIAITTLLLSYLIILPAVMRLKTKYPHVPRPYSVPGGNGGFIALGVLALAWIVLGSWVALFPGTLEGLFGLEYPFEEIWGLSQLRFEIFTLGTMALVILLGIAGYIGGAKLRQTIGPDPEAPQGALGD